MNRQTRGRLHPPERPRGRPGPQSGMYAKKKMGWRKITLYVILTTLILIVFINIALTFYIMTVLRFSVDGIGSISIVEGGIQVFGRAFLNSQLLTSRIEAPSGRSLTFLSHRNFTVAVRDEERKLTALVLLEPSGFEVTSESFNITDSHGRSLLSAQRGEVRLGADTLRVTGEGGVSVDTSIQTPLVRADTGQELILESTTRSLNVKAPQSITIESSARGITVNTLRDIRLTSTVGSIQLEAENVYIHNLTTAKPVSAPQPLPVRRPTQDIYQLCACADGKLFLASPEGICQTQPGDVCR